MTKRTETLASKIRQFLILVSVALTCPSPVIAAPAAPGEVYATIQGQVIFQKRSTLVPLNHFQALLKADTLAEALDATAQVFCNGMVCPESNQYWALIIQNGNTTYELHEPFAVGSERAPEMVRVNGVTLRSGAEVQVEATVETVSPNYGIISEIKNVSIVGTQGLDSTRAYESLWGVEGANWNCQNADNLGYSVSAVVWYGRRSLGENEMFHLKVVTQHQTDSGRLQNMTDIGNVEMRQLARDIVYQGAIDDTSAALVIRRNSPQFQTFPSMLTVKTATSNGSVRMNCVSSTVSSL